MRLTEDELIEIWRYFQYCCLPSIVMAKYAYLDYVGDIKEDKKFCRHEIKQDINRIGKYLEVLPNRLMDVSNLNVKYMNILSDNIEELFEEETEEFHKSIYLTFKNAKMKPYDCLTAIHYISAMLHISVAIFEQCCGDLKKVLRRDPTKLFYTYNLKEVSDTWEKKVVDVSTKFFGYDKENKKVDNVDLNNPRCLKAIDSIRRRYADPETLRTALRKSYPWSPNYEEGVPFERSIDYLIVNTNNEK